MSLFDAVMVRSWRERGLSRFTSVSSHLESAFHNDEYVADIPSKSNYHRDTEASLVLGYEEKYAPARMDDDAWRLALIKFFPTRNVNITIFDYENALREVITRLRVAGGSDVLSFDEACDMINRPKSSGYALREFRNALGENNKGVILDDPELRKSLETAIQEYRYGATSPSELRLKCELRDKERVLAHKTRIFSSYPLEGVINGLHLFGDMNRKIYENPFNTPFLIGINPMHDFDRIYRIFKAREELGYVTTAYDDSNLDNTTSAQSFVGDAWVRWNLLNPVEQTHDHFYEIENFYRESSFSPVLIRGKMCERSGGLLSGSPVTITDNCINMLAATMYGYFKYCRLNKIPPNPEKDVLSFIVGDDVITSAIPELTREWLKQTQAEIGYICNPEEKTGIDNVTFLSGSFGWVEHIHQYCRIPDKDKLRESACFYKGDPKNYRSRLEGLLLQAFVHKDLFDDLWNLYLEKFGENPPFTVGRLEKVYTHNQDIEDSAGVNLVDLYLDSMDV